MADSAIGDLPSISTDLVSTDLFVLERSGSAMKVSGQQLSEFMDRTVMAVTITAVASTDPITYSFDSATGTLTIGIPVGQGISSIAKTSTSGLVDTYTVYRDDNTVVDTFTITNGSSIQSIARTSGDGSSGSTDVYTITLTNGNTQTFQVYNGLDGQGTVNSVNNVAPDQNLNVTLTASDITGIVDLIYPVGSIYISTYAANPSTLFSGTTWLQIQDTFLLSAGSTYNAGSTGGNAEQTLTEANIPAHTHGSKSLVGKAIYRNTTSDNYFLTAHPMEAGIISCEKNAYSTSYPGAGEGNSNKLSVMTIDATHEHDSFGGDGNGNTTAVSTMPPYLVVYMWERTA